MGYSGRYHAASLAAVFLALAVGILIGAGLGSDVVSGTAKDLEESLSSDLDQARDRVSELEAELDQEAEFGRLAAPALVDGRLRGREIAIVALGPLDDEAADAVRAALTPAGATVTEIAEVREPVDAEAVAEAAREVSRRPPSGADALELAARRTGRLLITGGKDFPALRSALLSRYSGQPGDVDGVVILRSRPELSAQDRARADRLEVALIEGMAAVDERLPLVGVERTSSEPSSIEFFDAHLTASVDNADELPGKVSLIYALGCAEGSFGVKETAGALMPDLLVGPGLACGRIGDGRTR